MTRDVNRSAFYDAERMLFRMLDRGQGGAHTVQIGGTELTVPAEARFASVESIGVYVDDVLALPAVRERFPRATEPVSVRSRRSAAAAHDQPDRAEIAVPVGADGRWALRELVVLHELAHHLDDSHGAVHGPGFGHALTELVGMVLGPEIALLYRMVLGDAGLLA